MRFSLGLLALAAGASAALTGPVDPNTIDACVRPCSIAASQQVGCLSPLHLSCICPGGKTNPQFQSAAVSCLLANKCDLLAAIDTSSALCKYGVDCQAPFRECQLATGEAVCIDPSIQTCASGAVVNNHRRALEAAACSPGQEACRVYGGPQLAFECIDTQTNIEACGGCPLAGGADCTAIFGAAGVACKRGQCVVDACERGLALVDGRCK